MSSYKLYYSPGACSMAIHVLLLELEQPFELIKVDLGAKSPVFLEINPRGQVPVLVTPEGQTLVEGGAQIVWLCNEHQSQLLPTRSAPRATALQWLMTANASLHPAYGALFRMYANKSPEEAHAPFYKQIQKLWDEIEQQLAQTGAYICGDELTAADILLTVIANWNGYLKQPVTFGTNCKRLFTAVSSRASYKKAMAEEQVEYKAAA
ncbi:MAG: glutathione S-transferase family protein [Bdellovibrionales bacterium]